MRMTDDVTVVAGTLTLRTSPDWARTLNKRRQLVVELDVADIATALPEAPLMIVGKIYPPTPVPWMIQPIKYSPDCTQVSCVLLVIVNGRADPEYTADDGVPKGAGCDGEAAVIVPPVSTPSVGFRSSTSYSIYNSPEVILLPYTELRNN